MFFIIQTYINRELSNYKKDCKGISILGNGESVKKLYS